jgi:hypothetical protein
LLVGAVRNAGMGGWSTQGGGGRSAPAGDGEGRKREERREKWANMWDPPQRGVHISESGYQNRSMTNCEWF